MHITRVGLEPSTFANLGQMSYQLDTTYYFHLNYITFWLLTICNSNFFLLSKTDYTTFYIM